jgi:hypothetical protein
VIHRIRHRSPATLASWLNKVLDAGDTHLPLVTELARTLERHTTWKSSRLEASLHDLHESVTALDVNLAGTTAGADTLRRRADAHVDVIERCTAQALAEAQMFVERTAQRATAARPVLLEFMLEVRALEKLAERAAAWQAELEKGLAARQQATVAEVSLLALENLAGRSKDIGLRLLRLQSLVAKARRALVVAEGMTQARLALDQSLQGNMQRACTQLQKKVDAWMEAGDEAAGVARWPALAAARSDTQIWITQALSLLLRMHSQHGRLTNDVEAIGQHLGWVQEPAEEGRMTASALTSREGAWAWMVKGSQPPAELGERRPAFTGTMPMSLARRGDFSETAAADLQ